MRDKHTESRKQIGSCYERRPALRVGHNRMKCRLCEVIASVYSYYKFLEVKNGTQYFESDDGETHKTIESTEITEETL
jgi:hypothetical protein